MAARAAPALLAALVVAVLAVALALLDVRVEAWREKLARLLVGRDDGEGELS